MIVYSEFGPPESLWLRPDATFESLKVTRLHPSTSCDIIVCTVPDHGALGTDEDEFAKVKSTMVSASGDPSANPKP